MDDARRKRMMMAGGCGALLLLSCCCCGIGAFQIRHDITSTIHDQQYRWIDQHTFSAPGDTFTYDVTSPASSFDPAPPGSTISELAVACGTGTFTLTATPLMQPPSTLTGSCDGFYPTYVHLPVTGAAVTVSIVLSEGDHAGVDAYSAR